MKRGQVRFFPPPLPTKAAAVGNSQRSQKGTFSQIHTSTAFFLPSLLRDTFLGVVKNFRLPAKSQFFTSLSLRIATTLRARKKPPAQSEPGRERDRPYSYISVTSHRGRNVNIMSPLPPAASTFGNGGRDLKKRELKRHFIFLTDIQIFRDFADK